MRFVIVQVLYNLLAIVSTRHYYTITTAARRTIAQFPIQTSHNMVHTSGVKQGSLNIGPQMISTTLTLNQRQSPPPLSHGYLLRLRAIRKCNLQPMAAAAVIVRHISGVWCSGSTYCRCCCCLLVVSVVAGNILA